MIYKVSHKDQARSCLHAAFNRDGPIEVIFDAEEGVYTDEIPINILRCTRCDRRFSDILEDVVWGTRHRDCPWDGCDDLEVITTVELVIQGMQVLFRGDR
jgi:hypothetical protein